MNSDEMFDPFKVNQTNDGALAKEEPKKQKLVTFKLDPFDYRRSNREPAPNEYDLLRDKGMSKEDRATVFYRSHTWLVEGPDRKETRNYMESVHRLLPMPRGGSPITSNIIDKTFRGESGRAKRARRALDAAIRSKSNRAKKSQEHKAYLAGTSKYGRVSKSEWREQVAVK